MELKVYLQVMLKKWWVVLPVFLITLTAGIFLTYTTPPSYQATATYIVVPSGAPSDDIRIYTNALEAIGRREEIATTFSEIASSRNVKVKALESLPIESGGDYSVSSKLRPGTNIIEFTVSGPDPVIVRDFANAIGGLTEEFVQGFYDVFTLVPLDTAGLPRKPVSPNTSLNITMAAIFGLILGGGLAFLSAYLETPVDWVANVNIIDHQTGLYNKEYFLRRLSAEMVRSKRNRYPLSVAMMRITDLDMLKGSNAKKVRTEILHKVAMLTSQYLREEDLLAYVGNDSFVFLLPDMTGENAKAVMEYLHTRVGWVPFQSAISDVKLTLKGVFGVTTFNLNGASRDDLVAQVDRALKLAEVSEAGNVYFLADGTDPQTS